MNEQLPAPPDGYVWRVRLYYGGETHTLELAGLGFGGRVFSHTVLDRDTISDLRRDFFAAGRQLVRNAQHLKDLEGMVAEILP